MFKKVLETNINWDLNKLKRLEYSLTDVNYHSQAKILGEVIDALQKQNKSLAEETIQNLHKSMEDEIKEQEADEDEENKKFAEELPKYVVVSTKPAKKNN